MIDIQTHQIENTRWLACWSLNESFISYTGNVSTADSIWPKNVGIANFGSFLGGSQCLDPGRQSQQRRCFHADFNLQKESLRIGARSFTSYASSLHSCTKGRGSAFCLIRSNPQPLETGGSKNATFWCELIIIAFFYWRNSEIRN